MVGAERPSPVLKNTINFGITLTDVIKRNKLSALLRRIEKKYKAAPAKSVLHHTSAGPLWRAILVLVDPKKMVQDQDVVSDT